MKTWKVLSLVFAVMLILAIPALAEECAHNWTDWHVVSEPTCEHGGTQQRTCLICGAVDYGTTSPSTDHSYVTTQDKAATCTEDGVFTQECTVCHKVVSETRKALGHDMQDVGEEVPAKCTTDGHIAQKCTRCGFESDRVTTKATGHHLVKVSEVPATCEKGGTEHYICDNGDCTYTEDKATDPLGHLWRDELREDPTCTEEGSVTKWCVRPGVGNCFDTVTGKSKTKDTTILPALGHNVDIKAETTKNSATCTADGTYSGYCTRCKEWIADYAPSKALGHDLAPWKKDADGNEYSVCKRCDQVIPRSSVETPVQPSEPTNPDQPGTTPEQPGTTPDQPGTTPDQPGTTNGNHGSGNSSSTSSSGVEIPATGDSSVNWAYAMFAASLVGLMVVAAKRRALQK